MAASNAVDENINSQIQATLVRARGFQSIRSLINIIFLTTGKLQNLPANLFAHAFTQRVFPHKPGRDFYNSTMMLANWWVEVGVGN